jgi:hypothetical protein
VAYANGQIPAAALHGISGRAGACLLSGPAASWERMFAEVRRRYGWSPTPTGPSDAYRDLATQVATFLDRYTPARTGGGVYGDVRWWNGVRYVRKAGKAAAAVPGTSNHGKGRAVDVTGLGGFTGTRYAQFAAVAIPLGWSNAEGRSVDEPWHWVDVSSPELVSSGHATVPGISVPVGPIGSLTPLVPQEDIMASRADLQTDIANALAPVNQQLVGLASAVSTLTTITGRARWYKIDGTTLAWLDLGSARRMGTLEQYAAAPAGVVPLKVTDPFWRLPIVGPAWGGEGYRRPGKADVWFPDVVGGKLVRRYPGRDGYIAAGSPAILDLPVAHPFWALDVPAADPAAPEGR